jgi:membrane protein
VKRRRHAVKAIVRLWVDLFAEHNLLTYASAIALRTFVAAVACVLFALGVLGEAHKQDLWRDTIGPAIADKVLVGVYIGIDQTVQKVFDSSSVGLIALASGLAVWEVSGIVRASMGALDQIHEREETRPWWIRFPLSFGLAVLLLAALLGAIVLVWFGDAPGAWGVPVVIVRWAAAIALLAFAFEVIVRWAPAEHPPRRWATAGSLLVVVCWIGQTFLFGWYVRSLANFRTAVGSLEVFIFLATFFYIAAIVLLVAMELDELVRKDVEKSERRLLPHVEAVLKG